MSIGPVWIPYYPNYRSPSVKRISLHINQVLSSMDISTHYSPVNYPPFKGQIRNALLVNQLSVSTYPIHNVVPLANNKVYYGTADGQIRNPPNGFKIVVPSLYVAEECEKIDLKYEMIIPHGFDPKQFDIPLRYAEDLHNRMAGDKVLFYSVGGSRERKGYPRLLKAIEKAKALIGNKFMVYIRTEYSSYIHEILKRLNDVVLIDYNAYRASDHEIALEMMACDCYLAGSLAEGFYLPALEAMYGCGKPVIYPSTSPYTDYLKPESGYPVPVIKEKTINYRRPSYPYLYSVRMKYWDVDEFADSMTKVVDKPQTALAKGKRGLNYRHKWTIHNLYRRFHKLLE